MTNMRPIAATAAVLLHLAVLAAILHGLEADPAPDPVTEPVKVQLLAIAPAPPVEQQPVTPPPKPAPPAPTRERPAPKAQPNPRPAPSPQGTVPLRAPEPATEAKPQFPAAATPSIPSAPPPSAAAPAVPVAPSAPVRTSASEASYASTNRVPPYPRISALNGDEGTVILRVLVTAEGTAGAVEIKTSSGHAPLDESARKTVQTWRFKPATVDGKPVAEWYQVPIPFKLQNN